MLVAKLENLFLIPNFVKAAEYAHNADADTVYVFALSVVNIAMAKLVIPEIERAKLYSKNTEWSYKILGGRDRHIIPAYVAEMVRIQSQQSSQ